MASPQRAPKGAESKPEFLVPMCCIDTSVSKDDLKGEETALTVKLAGSRDQLTSVLMKAIAAGGHSLIVYKPEDAYWSLYFSVPLCQAMRPVTSFFHSGVIETTMVHNPVLFYTIESGQDTSI